jgi:hypothetical protein
MGDTAARASTLISCGDLVLAAQTMELGAPTRRALVRRYTWQFSKCENAQFAEHASRRPEAQWRAFGSMLKAHATIVASRFLASEVQKLCTAYEGPPAADLENNEMYTPGNILRREMLKTNPRVLAVLDRLWEAIDTDMNGVVDEGEYVVMSRKLQALLTVDVHTHEETVALAKADWERDRRGEVQFCHICCCCCCCCCRADTCARFCVSLRIVYDCPC